MTRIIHICSCGRRFTHADWMELEYIGTQATYADPISEPDEPEVLEMRNCPCGSTRTIGIDFDGMLDPRTFPPESELAELPLAV